MHTNAVLSKVSIKSDDTCEIISDTESDICRDYLRNICKRGKKCKYKHTSNSSFCGVPTREPIFCHDFQNGVCRRPSCKFLHYTKLEENSIRFNGAIPNASASENRLLNVNIPVCKDFLNHNCHRGSLCKFRHGKHISSSTVPVTSSECTLKPPTYNNHENHVIYSPPNHFHHQYQNSGATSRTTESAVTAPETTAMVAAAAAAGYLVMQNHGQQHHQHNPGGQNAFTVTSISTPSLPPASAAAVAAAAAATALATTHHHQVSLSHRFSEPMLSIPQSTSIPVMQSILGAVTHSNVLRSSCSTASAYPTQSSIAINNILTEANRSYYNDSNVHRGCLTSSHCCASQDEQMNTAATNNGAHSNNFANPDVISHPVTSCASFSQHRQQQDANTAAAVAAAACFGAMLSQPVAAAAAASHAVVSKPTAGDMLSQAVNSEHALSSMPVSSSVGVANSAAVASAAGPPPTAVAAAAAAAVAAAVVSSAGPSAAVAAMSAAHLATTSFSHARPATRVSYTPSGTANALIANESDHHRNLCGHNEAQLDIYGSDEGISSHRILAPSPPSSIAVNPSSLGSSAATAAYTATMTTAAAAAAMAAAVAVEEHNQKTNAAVAAIAALNESAALVHGMQSISCIADQSSISRDPLPVPGHILTTKPLEDSAIYRKSVLSRPISKTRSHHHLCLPLTRRQSHFPPPAYDVLDDESYEESYFEDEVDDVDEVNSSPKSVVKKSSSRIRVCRSNSPDHMFGRSLPIVDKPRQRSLSFPACTRSKLDIGTEKIVRAKEIVKSVPLSKPSLVSTTGPTSLVYCGSGIPFKRPKLVTPRSINRVASPSPSSTYVRRRYHLFPRRIRQIDLESEIDVEDEEDDLCFVGNAAYYNTRPVVATPYRDRFHILKRENVQLRLQLRKAMQQRNHLQVENHALKQNLDLCKFGSSAGNMEQSKPALTPFLSTFTRRKSLLTHSLLNPSASNISDRTITPSRKS